MLTEAEKKWLETRLQNLKVSGWFSCTEGELIPLVNFHRKHLNSDWQDAAEFEARVAAKLVSNNFPCRNCPDFLIGTKCPITTRGSDTDYGPFPCLLRQARLAVEEEMEKEGK